MATANDVAAAILERTGPISTMKLQKLLYYCQGWHLAWDGVPLFKDRIEAWANGPVVRSVYDNHRGHFKVGPRWRSGKSKALRTDEMESVAVVVADYGDWSARELVVATHQEQPWLDARRGLPVGVRSNREITPDAMQDYFAGLLEADDA